MEHCQVFKANTERYKKSLIILMLNLLNAEIKKNQYKISCETHDSWYRLLSVKFCLYYCDFADLITDRIFLLLFPLIQNMKKKML